MGSIGAEEAMANYLSLEEAATKLGVPTDRLVELRSQGEIRGFRDGASWKFPENEIDRLADELGDTINAGGTILGGDTPPSDDGSGSDVELGSEVLQSDGGGSDVNLIAAEYRQITGYFILRPASIVGNICYIRRHPVATPVHLMHVDTNASGQIRCKFRVQLQVTKVVFPVS